MKIITDDGREHEIMEIQQFVKGGILVLHEKFRMRPSDLQAASDAYSKMFGMKVVVVDSSVSEIIRWEGREE